MCYVTSGKGHTAVVSSNKLYHAEISPEQGASKTVKIRACINRWQSYVEN